MHPDLLARWLPNQRWFGGKGREFAIVDQQRIGTIPNVGQEWPGPEVAVWLVTLEYAEGDRASYQVPVERRDHAVDHLSHALIGEDEGGFHYDALHDKEITGRWLRAMADDAEYDGLRFRHEPVSTPFPLDEPSIVVGTEQSNTSLIFGDALILKVFRKVSPGLNPDIEVHSALAAIGNEDVAPLLGWLEGTWRVPDSASEEGAADVSVSLAMLQTYLRSATGGWELALASVRDLYAEGDLHADEVGGDFAAEAHRLGATTAEVHADLARTLPTGTAGPQQCDELAQAMRRRFETAVAVVPELAEFRAALGPVYDELAALTEPVPVQRIHGDFHLGQVMRTLEGWRLLDFEGEPARPLDERRSLASPLRDVAGMMRSFDYAARHLLVGRTNAQQLQHRADEWVERNCAAFCDGYAEGSGHDPRDSKTLLRAFETDKVFYEVLYEARHRPAWIPIPMAAVRRLAGE
jgi:maltokinase